jgi:hypothetical protein
MAGFSSPYLCIVSAFLLLIYHSLPAKGGRVCVPRLEGA